MSYILGFIIAVVVLKVIFGSSKSSTSSTLNTTIQNADLDSLAYYYDKTDEIMKACYNE